MTNETVVGVWEQTAEGYGVLAAAARIDHMGWNATSSWPGQLGPEGEGEWDGDQSLALRPEICPQCGTLPSSGPSRFRLCERCRESRLASLEALKRRVRRHFGLKRSPHMRSCMLNLLLLGSVDLKDPEGWRAGMALGSELKAAGFLPADVERVLNWAGGQEKLAKILTERVYLAGKVACPGWGCRQLRGLEIDCSGCINQFSPSSADRMTQVVSG